MSTSSSAIRRQTVDRRPSQGGILDGRSPVARRRRELIAIYTAALGGSAAISDGQAIDIRRAAELVALAETERAKALRGEDIDLSALIRIEGAADRAVRRLGIKSCANQAKPPSIKEYAAAKAAQKTAGGAGDAPA